MQVKEYKSNHSFEETIERIKEGLKGIQFGVLAELSYNGSLEKKGFPITKKAQLLEVCKPALAQGILEGDTGYSYFLPCKIIVREDGKDLYAGFLSVKDNLVEKGGQEVEAMASDVEEKMNQVIEKACQ